MGCNVWGVTFSQNELVKPLLVMCSSSWYTLLSGLFENCSVLCFFLMTHTHTHTHTRSLQNELAPNVMAMVQSFNRLALLVPTEILEEKTPQARSKVITAYIRVSTTFCSSHKYAVDTCGLLLMSYVTMQLGQCVY